MSTPADTVRALFAAFAARDVERVLALCGEDVRFWPQGTAEGAGRAEPYRGHAGVRQYFADVGTVWRSIELVPGDFRLAGAAVVAFGRVVGVLADGEPHDVPVIWVFKTRDGRCVDIRAVATAEEAMRVADEP